MNLLKRWLKIVTVEREVNRLTAQEWRADKHFVAAAAGVLMNPQLKLMLDCVANSAPGFDVLPTNANPQERIVVQARQEGYVMALATLMSLGKEQPFMGAIEATFEEDRKEA